MKNIVNVRKAGSFQGPPSYTAGNYPAPVLRGKLIQFFCILNAFSGKFPGRNRLQIIMQHGPAAEKMIAAQISLPAAVIARTTANAKNI